MLKRAERQALYLGLPISLRFNNNIIIIIYLFKVGMIKIAKKLIKANHLTKVKLHNPIYMFFIKILNYLCRSCIIYSCNH